MTERRKNAPSPEDESTPEAPAERAPARRKVPVAQEHVCTLPPHPPPPPPQPPPAVEPLLIAGDYQQRLRDAIMLVQGAAARVDVFSGALQVKHDLRQGPVGWVPYATTTALFAVWPEVSGVV